MFFKRIVVGIDGRAGGEDAFALAGALGGADARLVLVNAFPAGHAPALDPLDVLPGSVGVERRAVADASPGRALQRVAEDTHADLVVVGSCHHGPVARVLLGDVSRAVLHGAPCAVAVAPRGWREQPHRLTRIGVGYKRTPEAQAALVLAAALARAGGGALRLRTSVPPPAAFVPAYAYTYDWEAVEARGRALAREDLEEATAMLDVPATVDTTTGTPGLDLADLSEHVDLLVVGSRGYGAGRRVLLGSTSDRLVHRAACPVLVVPAVSHDRAPAREEVLHA